MNAQIDPVDIIYGQRPNQATFPGGEMKLFEYNNEHIFPILNQIRKEQGLEINRFIYRLDISETGAVEHAEILKNDDISEVNKCLLIEAMMQMPKWNPAIWKDKPVKSRVNVPYRCLKWE